MSFPDVLAITADQNWDIENFNINSAYFNGELDANKETYMQAPLGYDNDRHTVKCLINLLYALTQAGRRLYDMLVYALKASDSTPVSPIQRCSSLTWVSLVHVDDCILMVSSGELIAEYKQRLNPCYALTDLRSVYWLLGIKVTHNRTACTLSLSHSSGVLWGLGS